MLGGRLTRFFFFFFACRRRSALFSAMTLSKKRDRRRKTTLRTFAFVCGLVQDGLCWHDFTVPRGGGVRGGEEWKVSQCQLDYAADGASYKTHTHTQSHTDAQRSRVEQQAMTSLLKYEKQEVVSMACWKSPPSERESFNSPLFLQPLKPSFIVAAQLVLDHFRQVGRWGSIV